MTDNGQPVTWLNELEWIDGEVWANIWQTDCIAKIDPVSGRVTAWVLLDVRDKPPALLDCLLHAGLVEMRASVAGAADATG